MKKSVVLIIHSTFWAVIYITIYTVLRTILKDPFPPVGGSPFWTYEWLALDTLVSVLLPFYSFYFLLPKLSGKKYRLLWYGIALILLISWPALILSIDGFTINSAANYPGSFLLYLFVAFIGSLFRVFFQWVEQSKQRVSLENQNLKSELALLRHQINPHFLFNSLNNVDSLIHEDTQKASLALNKLAEIMRYMMYDSEREWVPLREEITCIESYLSLQRLRITNGNKVSFNVRGDMDNIQIAPMLFIAFIENAFKHSSLKKPEHNIRITLDVSKTQIDFSCTNRLSCPPAEEDESSGIGLEIINKRLDLIYPHEHELRIEKSEQKYEVHLKIQINAN
jgi:two-component system, LytTR family, sensor kinase